MVKIINTLKKNPVCSLMAVFFAAFLVINIFFPNVIFATQEETIQPGDTTGITEKFNLLLELVKSIVMAIGSLVCLWGIAEWGIAFQSNDGMMQTSAWKRIAGGFVMALAPAILTAFGL